MMKKLILSLAFILSVATFITAQMGDKQQNREESKNRKEASKAAYLTSYLDLSNDEVAKFLPIYNDYQADLKSLRGERGKRKKSSELTDAEATAMLDNQIDMSSQKSNINAKYLTRVRSVLSDKQVLLLSKAERDFKKHMIKRRTSYKGQRGNSEKRHRSK